MSGRTPRSEKSEVVNKCVVIAQPTMTKELALKKMEDSAAAFEHFRLPHRAAQLREAIKFFKEQV